MRCGTILALALLSGCANTPSMRSEHARPIIPTAPAKVERPDEMIPATEMRPADIHQVLLLYADLTGASLEVEEAVRQLRTPIAFKRSYPAMTRAQAVDTIDDALFQAGVVVTHPDTKHVTFRLKR